MMSRRLVALVLVLLALLGAGWVAFRHWRALDPLAEALSHRGLVLVAGEEPPRGLRVVGTEWREASAVADVRAALAGQAASTLAAALRTSGARGLLVGTRATARAGEGASLLERFAALDVVDGFHAEAIAATSALYVPDASVELGSEERAALPRVARLVLSGTPPPLASQFPPALRAPRPVEILVLVRDRDGTPRLWRSARGSSIASALLTALASARDRWEARALALGGSAEATLAERDVEVARLIFDGDLLEPTRELANRAISPAHGVGYQSPSDWRYVLPEMLRREGVRTGAAAFEELFRDNGLPLDSLRRTDLRFYRLRVESYGVSRALAVDELDAPAPAGLPDPRDVLVPAEALKPPVPAGGSTTSTPRPPADAR